MSGLVVVDMQPGFQASTEPNTYQNVKKLIQKFMKDQNPIFIMEYRGYNPTHDELLYGVYRYEQAFWIRKDRDDGSKWLHNLVSISNLEVKDLVVCGINASFCVAETAMGLMNKGYDVTIPKGAVCNSEDQIPCYGLDGAGTMDYIKERYSEKFKLHPVIELLGSDPEERINL